MNHACRLRCFVPGKMTPYMLLESLSHLRERQLLSPEWLALEENIETAFRASEANNGWIWRLDGNSRLFDNWKFNLHKPTDSRADAENTMKLVEDELVKIVDSQAPQSEEMIKSMDYTIVLIKDRVRQKINALLDELLSK